tara:strand:+ start:2703 stop:3299 length:597 start_codon:yes stop_codon:yes gene_type:complete
MIINRAQLSRTLARQASPKLSRQFENKIREIVKEAQKIMLANFSAHPVTREIEGGPTARNLSNTLVGANNKANLFGFIGFDRTESPTQAIRIYLAQQLEIRQVRKSNKDVIIDFEVKIPSLDKLYEISPMPWAPGLSWAEGIERGIPGLGQYLVGSAPKGRSGGGIQAKVEVNSGSFRSVKYLSKILTDFVNDVMGAL